MNPPCARCKKTVYPVEKLSCLDKYWHKGCFNCEVCNLKLTMKTYKGYNKLPYCETHYPTTKFTAVADTPENKRLAQQTKNQSLLNYHADQKASLSQFHQVADSVEGQRMKKSQEQASHVAYSRGDQGPPPAVHQPPQFQPPAPAPAPAPAPSSGGPQYVAVYDYAAADSDEVSFVEGDIIVEATVIDSGWMEGRVQRTGEYGMLPSNYVEPR